MCLHLLAKTPVLRFYPTIGEHMKTNTLISKKLLVRSLTAAGLAITAAFIGAGPVSAQTNSGMKHEDMQSGGSNGSMKMHMTMQDGQKKMNDMKMSGDTDHDFAMMMRAHHQAGIDMAKAEIDSGKDPEMIKEAKQITASQQKDNKKFDAWLAKHPAK
jgi:uncharacterized protein (DUF305 family)